MDKRRDHSFHAGSPIAPRGRRIGVVVSMTGYLIVALVGIFGPGVLCLLVLRYWPFREQDHSGSVNVGQ